MGKWFTDDPDFEDKNNSPKQEKETPKVDGWEHRDVDKSPTPSRVSKRHATPPRVDKPRTMSGQGHRVTTNIPDAVFRARLDKIKSNPAFDDIRKQSMLSIRESFLALMVSTTVDAFYEGASKGLEQEEVMALIAHRGGFLLDAMHSVGLFSTADLQNMANEALTQTVNGLVHPPEDKDEG